MRNHFVHGGTTRRRLLAGAATGAVVLAVPGRAAAQRRSRARPAGEPKGRVVVVGAGLAGLTAAHELARRRWEVLVVEASDRVGGRVKTVRRPFARGQHGEAGGEYIDDAHTDISAYARRFGIPLEDTERGTDDGSDAIFVHRRRRRQRAVATPAVQAAIDRYDGAMDRLAGSVDPASAAAAPNAGTLDAQSVGDLLDRLALSPAARFFVDQDIRDDYLVEPGALSLLFHAAEWELPGTAAGTERYRLRGGNDRLPRALAASLPAGALHLRNPVIAIHQDRGGVRITTTAGAMTYAADACVLAAPLPALRDVVFDPPLPDPLPEAIARLQYGVATKTLLQYDARAWREGGFSGSAFSDLPAATFYEATDGQPGGGGILIAYTAADRGVAAAALDERARIAQAAGDAAQVFPAVRGRLIGGATASCGYTAYAPGQVVPFWDALRRPAGRIVLAGEHTDTWTGYMNGALRSGARAASLVDEG